MTATAPVAPLDARPESDLLDPDFYRADPHPAFTWMRANEPLFRDERNGLWGVTRHADVLEAERRSSVFVSSRGYRSWFSPEENNMIALDDPAHLAQRRLVSNRFTPRSVRVHAEWLEATVTTMLDDIAQRCADGGDVEIVDALASQLPCRLTARLLGFPEDRWADIKVWSENLMRIDAAPSDPEIAMGLFRTIGEFAALLGEEVPPRRGCPVHEAPDLLSVWVNAEVDGRHGYGEDRLVHETGLFIAGGAETTRTVIAHGLDVLAAHPDAWEQMAADPAVVPTAVEELIRWVTPLNNFFRTAVEDTELGGHPVAEGDRLILLYPSANRDEAVFEDPFRFDIGRSPNPHVAFGHGTHFCVGANLARYELTMLFRDLTARFEPPRVTAGPEVERNIFARSVESLRVSLVPRVR